MCGRHYGSGLDCLEVESGVYSVVFLMEYERGRVGCQESQLEVYEIHQRDRFYAYTANILPPERYQR